MLMGQEWYGREWSEGISVGAFLDGEVRLIDIVRSGAVCRLVFRPQGVSDRPSPRERLVIGKVAAGASQKAVAYELGVALTTVSAHLRVGLSKLGLKRPEQIVLTAAILERSAQAARIDETPTNSAEGEPFLVVKAELPEIPLSALTRAEREVVLLLVDGLSNQEIARERAASPRTVANQIAGAFRKFDVHCRSELIRSLVLARPSNDASGTEWPNPAVLLPSAKPAVACKSVGE